MLLLKLLVCRWFCLKMFQILRKPRKFIDMINFIEVTNKRFISIPRPSSSFVNCPSENRFCCPILRANPSWLVLSRNKYTGKGKRRAKMEDEGSSDEEDEDDDEENTDVKTYSVNAARCDLIIKSVLNISRKTVEEHFYHNKIRVNGITLLKKSQNVSVGDEMDIIKSFSPESDSLTVDRIQVVDIKQGKETGKILVKAAKHKSLIVKNYDDVNAFRETEEE